MILGLVTALILLPNHDTVVDRMKGYIAQYNQGIFTLIQLSTNITTGLNKWK